MLLQTWFDRTKVFNVYFYFYGHYSSLCAWGWGGGGGNVKFRMHRRASMTFLKVKPKELKKLENIFVVENLNLFR
jgi:hypothetical protein